MKKWEKPIVNELGLEKTKENTCTVKFDGITTYTEYPLLGSGCIKNGRYEAIDKEHWNFRCIHYDPNAEGGCKLNIEGNS